MWSLFSLPRGGSPLRICSVSIEIHRTLHASARQALYAGIGLSSLFYVSLCLSPIGLLAAKTLIHMQACHNAPRPVCFQADCEGGRRGRAPPFEIPKRVFKEGARPLRPPPLKFQSGSSNRTAAAPPPLSTNPGSAPGPKWGWLSPWRSHGGAAMGAQPWGRSHGGAAMGAQPWGRSHGGAAMGAQPWGRSHGGAAMGAQPWGRSHGGAARNFWKGGAAAHVSVEL